jgi:hypothetical protein
MFSIPSTTGTDLFSYVGQLIGDFKYVIAFFLGLVFVEYLISWLPNLLTGIFGSGVKNEEVAEEIATYGRKLSRKERKAVEKYTSSSLEKERYQNWLSSSEKERYQNWLKANA